MTLKLFMVTGGKSSARILKSRGLKHVMCSHAFFKNGVPNFPHVIYDSGAFTEFGKVAKTRHPWLQHLDACKCKNVDFHVMLDKIGDQMVTCNRYEQHLRDKHKAAFVYYADAQLAPRVIELMDRSLQKSGATCFAGTTMRYMQRNGMSWPMVLKSMEKFFAAKKRGGNVHLLGSFNIKALTEFPFTSADTATWQRAGQFGSFLVFYRDEKGIHLKQLPYRGSIRDKAGACAKWKAIRDKAYATARSWGWNLNKTDHRLFWNLRVYKILERLLNAKHKVIDYDILEHILDPNEPDDVDKALLLEGVHETPHDPNGVHDHAGLPPSIGGHSHPGGPPRMFDPKMPKEEIIIRTFGGHRHRPDDPIEGAHVGTFGDGSHTHPKALGEKIELDTEQLAALHMTRPWLPGFVRAMIRERTTPDAPWGDWREWTKFDSIVHVIHPQHQPRTNVTKHVQLFGEKSPQQLIQKRYEFKDGTVRAPTEKDWIAEKEFFSSFSDDDGTEKAFHLRGTHWIEVPESGMCPVSHPVKADNLEGKSLCYTRGAATQLEAARSAQKDEGVDKKTGIQTVVFNKDQWNVTSARKWLRENDFVSDGKVDEPEGGNTLRFRQFNPDKCAGDFVVLSQNLPKGVQLTSCRLRRGVEKQITFVEAELTDVPPREAFKVFAPIVHHEESEVMVKGKTEKRRLIYGIVYEPYVVDAQGDWTDEMAIEVACHRWLLDSRSMKLMHRFNTDKVKPVESYIAPQDIKLGRATVKKGAWILVSKVFDDAIWAKVERREFTGYSLGGRSTVREGAPPRA